MVKYKRLYIAVITLVFLFTGGAVAWFFANGYFFPKPPLRAKQVMSIKIADQGINFKKASTL